MFKKVIFIAFVLVFALVLTACGNEATPAPAPAGPAPAPAEPAPAPAEPVDEGDSESTKTGVLIEASMHVATIQAPDGSTYTFGIDDNTTIEGSELLGNTMSITYEGEYTSGIIALSITTITEVDHAASSGKGSTSDPGAPQPKEPVSPADKVWYMTGTVMDASMNQLQLLYEDGKTYTVLKDDNTKTDSGIVVGCVARVFHKGSMKDGMVATEIHFIADAPPPDPASRTWYLTGTVTDASMHQLQLLYEDGNTYTILKDDNTRTDSGIAVGSIVRVYHKGLLADEMLATEIRLMPPS